MMDQKTFDRLLELKAAGYSLPYLMKSYVPGVQADLSGADLTRADLREANLRGANLHRTDLLRADLREADLSGADLTRADLREANLREANLRGADLREADLRGADLSGADLTRADLRGADLCGANLHRTDLLRADLREARYNVLDILRASWYGEISPGLCAAMMAFDRDSHPCQDAFKAWADGGLCPLNSAHVDRALIFNERRELYNHSIASPAPWVLWEMIAAEFGIQI